MKLVGLHAFRRQAQSHGTEKFSLSPQQLLLVVRHRLMAGPGLCWLGEHRASYPKSVSIATPLRAGLAVGQRLIAGPGLYWSGDRENCALYPTPPSGPSLSVIDSWGKRGIVRVIHALPLSP